MSLALVHSRARAGADAPLVRVEVHLSGGLPATQIVGVPETTVRESRERVRAALLCARFDYPQRRITIRMYRCQGEQWTCQNRADGACRRRSLPMSMKQPKCVRFARVLRPRRLYNLTSSPVPQVCGMLARGSA